MNNRYFLTIWGLALLPVFFLTYQFSIPAEDAVILYEYAKNLATQGVIAYGGANTPIEGATDFIWMLLIASFKKVGIPEFFSALLLSFTGTMILLGLAKSFKTRLVFFLGLVGTAYLYSALDGFSTLLFSAIYCWCLYLVLQKKSGLYLAILILCLVRPDGVVWGVGLVMLRLLDVSGRDARKQETRELFTYLVIPGLLYFLWRAWYFSEWLPLPFLVKAAGERDLVIFWVRSLMAVAIVLIPILWATIFVQNRCQYLNRILLLFVLPCLFYGAMQLEQNIGNRFLAPMFFGGMLLLSTEKKIISLVGFVIVSSVFAIPTTKQTVDDILDSGDENIYYISRELSNLTGKMLVTEAGRLAYYSGWLTHDSWGLNTPRYAHNPIKPADLKSGNYDLIVGHCQLELLKQVIPEQVYADKTWVNQCKVLISYIQATNYSIFLVPFLKESSSVTSLRRMLNMRTNNQGYRRYYLYAVSSNYKNSEALSNLLERHGGIKYTSVLLP
jgi:hypothetical protein